MTAEMEYKIGSGDWMTVTESIIGVLANPTNAVITARVKATASAPHGEESSYTFTPGTTQLTVAFNSNGGSNVESRHGQYCHHQNEGGKQARRQRRHSTDRNQISSLRRHAKLSERYGDQAAAIETAPTMWVKDLWWFMPSCFPPMPLATLFRITVVIPLIPQNSSLQMQSAEVYLSIPMPDSRAGP